jgi:hypothetical protein
MRITRKNYCCWYGGPYQNIKETIVKYLASAMMVLIRNKGKDYSIAKVLASAMLTLYHDIGETIIKFLILLW